MPVLKMRCPSPDSLYAGGRLHTTSSGRLLAICPDVSKFLAVVALRKGIFRSVCLYLDNDVTEVKPFE
jgi:hypothetical protein